MTGRAIRLATIWLAYTSASVPLQAAADWHLQADATTDMPVQVGGRIGVEMPHGLRASTAIGYLPGPYVDLINAVVVAAGGYDQDTADLVRHSLERSLVWRLHVGWRPWSELGLTFEFGYGLITLGGGVTGEELIVVAAGVEPPMAEPTGQRSYTVSSTLHQFDVEIGWRWVFWEHLVLRTAIGFAGTVAAATRVDPDYRPLAPRATALFTSEAEAYLDGIYTDYVFTPVVSISLGYRFF